MKNALIQIAMLLMLIVGLLLWVWLPPWMLPVLAGALLLWLAFTRSGRQTASVTRVALSTLHHRFGSSLVIVLGIGGVVGVLVALLAMGAGLQTTLTSGGSDESVIILRGGAPAEAQSVLGPDEMLAVAQAPGLARTADGQPLISGEVVTPVNVFARGSGDEASVQLRGVEDAAWAVRPQLKMIEGRKFSPGLNELVVGRHAATRYAGLQPGERIRLGSTDWQVVGVFESGDGHDSELWADRSMVADAARRGNSVSSLRARLTDASAFDALQAALESDPQLNVQVQTTAAYFAEQSAGLAQLIRYVGITVGVIMAIGAIFGALNCMFAAVATRAREIATLRALGFRSLPVVVSVLLETMVLALCGGLLGALLTWLIFNGYSAATLAGMSQVVFEFNVRPQLIWLGLQWALAMGFIGGVYPAVRAARLPVATALRER